MRSLSRQGKSRRFRESAEKLERCCNIFVGNYNTIQLEAVPPGICKDFMKNLPIYMAVYATTTALSSAAAFFFSFDTSQDGNGVFTPSVTANSGFMGTPTFSRTGTVFESNGQGGATSFTDFQGNTWLGSGNSNTPGHSSVWNQNGPGNSLSLTFSTIGLTDINVRFDVRTAGADAATSFTGLTYDIGGGEVAGPATSSFTSGAFRNYTEDLTALDAIEGQSSVTLRWSFADNSSTPSFRIDNIQVSAVPEPSVVLGGLVGGLLLLRRRRNG